MTAPSASRPVKTLLVADDHALIRSGMVAQLRSMGDFKFVEAWDAKSLHDAAANRMTPIDLALIDVVMPGIAGADVLQTFCEAHPSLAIVFITGLESATLELQFLRLPNVLGVLRKLDTPASFRISIDTVLRGEAIWPRFEGGVSAQNGSHPVAPQSSCESQQLSPRLLAVAWHVSAGMTNREIGIELDLVEGTVKNYVKDIFRILGVTNRTQLSLKLRQLR
jgi:DNA-binding NarL/FixJ family response regulator